MSRIPECAPIARNEKGCLAWRVAQQHLKRSQPPHHMRMRKFSHTLLSFYRRIYSSLYALLERPVSKAFQPCEWTETSEIFLCTYRGYSAMLATRCHLMSSDVFSYLQLSSDAHGSHGQGYIRPPSATFIGASIPGHAYVLRTYILGHAI